MLHRVDIRTRVCDIIHGPPTPSIQSCLDNMAIPWAASSGNLFNLLPKKSFQLNHIMYVIPKRPYSHATILYFYHGNTTGLAVFIPTEAPGAGKLLKMLSVFAYHILL